MSAVVGGGLSGYLAGGLIAGVFLLFNKVQPPLEDAEEKPPDAPADDTSRLSERVSELARLAGRRVRRYRGEFAELFPPGNQTGVPRRFGVAVMLVVTTMYAVLFAAIRTWVVVATLGPPAPAIIAALFVVIVGFFTIVGLSQAILFKGRNPRWASIVTGTILGPPAAMGVMLLASAPGLNSVDKLLAGLICGLPLWLGPRRVLRLPCRRPDRRSILALQQGAAAAGRPGSGRVGCAATRRCGPGSGAHGTADERRSTLKGDCCVRVDPRASAVRFHAGPRLAAW